jgi:hypothetical protein
MPRIAPAAVVVCVVASTLMLQAQAGQQVRGPHEWSSGPGNDPVASRRKVLAIMDVQNRRK